jgi:hypothetical protein
MCDPGSRSLAPRFRNTNSAVNRSDRSLDHRDCAHEWRTRIQVAQTTDCCLVSPIPGASRICWHRHCT